MDYQAPVLGPITTTAVGSPVLWDGCHEFSLTLQGRGAERFAPAGSRNPEHRGTLFLGVKDASPDETPFGFMVSLG